MWVYKRYDQFLLQAKRLANTNKSKFNYDTIRDRTKELLEKYVPKSALEVDIKLPTLKRLNPVKVNDETKKSDVSI